MSGPIYSTFLTFWIQKKRRKELQLSDNCSSGSTLGYNPIRFLAMYPSCPEILDHHHSFSCSSPFLRTVISSPIEKESSSGCWFSENKEQNNNNTSKHDQLKIPLSVNVNSSGKNMTNGFSQNQLSDSIIKAAQRHQGVSSTAPSSAHSYAAPPPIPARAGTTNLTYFAPRPFGTTYSTNALTNRIQAPVSSVNVHDEVRTSGSGQSSPASSEGSQKEIPHDIHGSLSNGPLQPTGAPTVYVRNGQAITGDRQKHSQQKSHDQLDSSHVSVSKIGSENGHQTAKDSSQNSNGSDNSVSNVTNGNSSTNISKQPLRYASKNLIANTYMGRLGPEAMKKYQQNFNLIYSGGSSENSDNKKDSGTKDQNNISDNVSNVPLSLILF